MMILNRQMSVDGKQEPDYQGFFNAGGVSRAAARAAPAPADVTSPGWRAGLTRTQAFIALALLKKVLPDLASVEVSGNPDKPLMVQVVRFSDGEQLEAPRPVVALSKLIEMDRTETVAIETEATGKTTERRATGRKNGHEWLSSRQRRAAERSR